MSKILFKTMRCIVREFNIDDIELLMEYRNNLEWMAHQGFKNKTKEEYIEALLVPFNIDQGTQIAFSNIEDDTLYGDLYLHKVNNEISIGYTINPKYARLGLTFEVLTGLIEYLKKRYPSNSIIADLDKDNTSSEKLLLKLGFSFVKKDDETLYYKLD